MAMVAAFHKLAPFTIGISVSDNFYRNGLSKTKDPRWKQDWETPYASLTIPFYVDAGNHDWDGTLKAIKAEIWYTDVSPSKSWRMRAPYDTFRAGPMGVLDALVHLVGVESEELHASSKRAGG